MACSGTSYSCNGTSWVKDKRERRVKCCRRGGWEGFECQARKLDISLWAMVPQCWCSEFSHPFPMLRPERSANALPQALQLGTCLVLSLLLGPTWAKQGTKQDGLQSTDPWPHPTFSEYSQFSEKTLKCFQQIMNEIRLFFCFDIGIHPQNHLQNQDNKHIPHPISLCPL